MTGHETKTKTELSILRLEDFSDVWDIFTATFPSKYNDEFRFSWWARATALSWGAWQNDKLVAFVITSYQKELQDSYHIHFIGTHPSVQKGGFGTTLLHNVIRQAFAEQKSVSLIPLANERLIRWYEKQGFSFMGEPILSPYTGEEERIMFLHQKPTERKA